MFVLAKVRSIIHCFSAVLNDSTSRGDGGGLKCCWFCLSGQMKDVTLTALMIAETLTVSKAGHLHPDWPEHGM